jgi:hypothetical protein
MGGRRPEQGVAASRTGVGKSQHLGPEQGSRCTSGWSRASLLGAEARRRTSGQSRASAAATDPAACARRGGGATTAGRRERRSRAAAAAASQAPGARRTDPADRRERRSKDGAPVSAREAATGGARTGGGANPSLARARARSGQREHAVGREKKEVGNERYLITSGMVGNFHPNGEKSEGGQLSQMNQRNQ